MINKNRNKNKPVILLAVDSLMPYPLEVATQTGRAPALKFLMESGQYYSNMVTSFPTMSVTIDSSLLTGTYADQHQVPGLTWFDQREMKIVNYGTGLRETYRLGWKQVATNMLENLNHHHLSKQVSTIYEELAKSELPSASINSFVYRGQTTQNLKVPRLLQSFTNFEDGEWMVKTPPIFSLGVFSKLRKWSVPNQIAAGNYKYAAKELRYLIKKNILPSFSLCMFHDLDTRIHFKGTLDIKGITKIDKEIQKILNMYSSWEDAIEQNVWIVIGDNGHAPTGTNYRKFVIDLRKILNKNKIARIEKKITPSDDVVICVNQRMAYIYVLNENIPLDQIVEQLKQDSRIDLIAWKNNNANQINVVSGTKQGLVRFSRNGEYIDEYDQLWNIEGNTEILDLTITKDNVVYYNDFPDALARVYGALYSHEGRFIVVNAKPGCDFKAQSTPFHLSGAAHGSLHKQESLVPLIITGTNKTTESTRIVDLKKFILDMLV